MARDYFPGMGQAVADRTINRKGEAWGDVARRVAQGNCAIAGCDPTNLERHIAQASILMSGRHLQHGDLTQPDRNIEVFTNCSTSSQRSLTFYLLLNGSGVGSSYDDAICIVDFRKMPRVVCTIRADHPDVLSGRITGYGTTDEELQGSFEPATIFRVPDSREGWAQAVEAIEVAAWEGDRENELLILDFSDVRPHGSPIGGMQGRPASGPGPLMDALSRVASVKYRKEWAPWRQAMQIDHELAECVLVGGARRAARIAVKYWRDPDILDFINVKKDGGLWSANNSVGVDDDFWVEGGGIFQAIIDAQYDDRTGEPGILNLEALAVGEGTPTRQHAMLMGGRYELSEQGMALRLALTEAAAKMKYPYIVNPCGEIRLHANGGYCVIADVVPFFAANDDDACDAFREATLALLRVNQLPAIYQGEVWRTNRIGVGLTGIHEYAWARFGLTFHDLVAEGDYNILDANGQWMKAPTDKAAPFWQMLQRFADVVEDVTEWAGCATTRTVKPAGTTSKLFGLTEGVHLPAMREYLRWVQFRSDDPLIERYREQGYPVRELETYGGTTIVGFPTQPLICQLGGEVVTAAEATPEQQFRWLRLLETFWLGVTGGNQISYTLKYDPSIVGKDEYGAIMKQHMPTVRAVSVMPQIDTTAYEYQPEEPISREAYDELVARIEQMAEDVDQVHIDCAGGVCPIDFRKDAA